MSLGSPHTPDSHTPGTPPPPVPRTNMRLIAVACVLLAIPVVALMWVSSYAKETPRLGGIPFFFWYQFLWVFICSALTYTAYRLVLLARHQSPGAPTRRDEEVGR